jgi:hypothetical protein
MQYNLRQNGEELFGELRPTPKGASTILRFDSGEGTQSPSRPQSEQGDARVAELPSGRNGGKPRGEGSTKFPDVPLLESVTITISVIEGRSKGLTYRFSKMCITVGRIGGGADFEFNEPEASEVHCFIAARPDSVRLYAAPAVGNIYVDDQPIGTVELTHASTFRVGSSRLQVSILPNNPRKSERERTPESK